MTLHSPTSQTTITLAPAHGYSMAVAFLSAFVVTWAGAMVGMARKKYGVEYPAMYAVEGKEMKKADADVFNCVQRGHQNILENYVSVCYH